MDDVFTAADIMTAYSLTLARNVGELPEEPRAVHVWLEGLAEPGGICLHRSVRDQVRDKLPVNFDDLGEITPDVEELRDELELPGMYVLQFGFDESDDRHAPEAHRERGVVYTGTHDNDTTRGWFEELADPQRARVLEHLRCAPGEVVRGMIEATWYT